MNSTFAMFLTASQGSEPAGERISGNIGKTTELTFFSKTSDNNSAVKRASVGGRLRPARPSFLGIQRRKLCLMPSLRSGPKSEKLKKVLY